MPGVTSIIGTEVVDDKSIQVFYNTEKLNLAFELKSGKATGSDSNQKFGGAAEDELGNVVNPSDLASADVFGVQFVVGFMTSPKANGVEDNKHVDLSILSPVHRLIKRITIYNKSVAMSSTGTAGYVYYTDGEAQNTIVENNLAQTNIKLDVHSGIVPKTSLAAYYDPSARKRYVIYQVTKNLAEYEAYHKQNNQISNSTGARKNTPLGVYYDADQNVVFLYYTDDSGGLRRIIKSDGEWGSSSGVPDTEPVDAASQISVTHSDGVNHIFYVADSERDIKHYRDRLED